MKDYPQNKWQIIRDAVTNATKDTELSATTSKWSTIKTAWSKGSREVDRWFTVPPRCNKAEVRFRSSANNNNLTFIVYGVRDGDDAYPVCTGTAYAGTQQATEQISSATTYHCDRIDLSTSGADYWIFPMLSQDEDGTVTNNKRCSLVLSTIGYKHFIILITAVSAGTVAADAVAYAS